MQLNLYVPKEHEAVLRALDEASRTTGRSKNLLVLDAIERYLGSLSTRESPKLRTYHMGEIEPWTRESLYEERMDHIAPEGLLRAAETPAEYDAHG